MSALVENGAGTMLPSAADSGCCKWNVERGAYWIAVLGIASGFFAILMALWTGFWPIAIDSLVYIGLYAGILVAQNRREANWYLPYLIYHGIMLIVTPIYTIAYLILSDEFTASLNKIKGSDGKSVDVSQITLATLIGMAVSESLGICAQSVVWRAYKCMKVEPPRLDKKAVGL